MEIYDICERYKLQLFEKRKKYPTLISDIAYSQLIRYIYHTCKLEGVCLPEWAIKNSLKGLPIKKGFQRNDIILVQNQLRAIQYAKALASKKILETDDIK